MNPSRHYCTRTRLHRPVRQHLRSNSSPQPLDQISTKLVSSGQTLYIRSTPLTQEVQSLARFQCTSGQNLGTMKLPRKRTWKRWREAGRLLVARKFMHRRKRDGSGGLEREWMQFRMGGWADYCVVWTPHDVIPVCESSVKRSI